MRIHIHGDTAVVTARSTFRGRYKGWGIAGQYQYTDVFVKRGGQWKAVASQVTLAGRGLLRLRLCRFIGDRLGGLRALMRRCTVRDDRAKCNG